MVVPVDATLRLTIGELAKRTGLSVRTVRFYSDAGVVPENGRSPAGYRLYDVDAVTRLETAVSLRELGFDLETVRRLLDRQVDLEDVVRLQAEALDAQISILRVRRAVLRALTKKESTIKDVELMNKLARLSAEERNRILAGFYDEVFGGLDIDPEFERRMRSVTPDLPDDPSAEQVEAWIELAELVSDAGFRDRVRQMAVAHSAVRQAGGEVMPDSAPGAEFVVGEQAGTALANGLDPTSPEAAAVLVPILDAFRGDRPDSAELRAELADRFAVGTDQRVERYWELLGVINGWGSFPSLTPAFEWTIVALRAHPAPIA
jgi:DNA-binding transcriptional MerR regulator